MKMRLDGYWSETGKGYLVVATDIEADGTDGRTALALSTPHREHAVDFIDNHLRDFPFYVLGDMPREHDGLSHPCHGKPGIEHRVCTGYAEGFYGQIAHPCTCDCHPAPFTPEWLTWLKACRPELGDSVVWRSLFGDHDIVRAHGIVVAKAKDGKSVRVLLPDGSALRLGQDVETGLFVDTSGAYGEFFNLIGKRPGVDDPLMHGTADIGGVGYTVATISPTRSRITLIPVAPDANGHRIAIKASRRAVGGYWTGKTRIDFNTPA